MKNWTQLYYPLFYLQSAIKMIRNKETEKEKERREEQIKDNSTILEEKI